MTQHTFRGPEVCRIAGISYRQLDYWSRTELLVASISEARGSGTQRRYNEDDVRVAVVLARCLDTGISLQRVRRALHYIREPEGCRWLVITGDVDAIVTDDLEDLALVLTEIANARLALVVDMAVELTTASPHTATPTDQLRQRWSKEAS